MRVKQVECLFNEEARFQKYVCKFCGILLFLLFIIIVIVIVLLNTVSNRNVGSIVTRHKSMWKVSAVVFFIGNVHLDKYYEAKVKAFCSAAIALT